MQPRLNTCIVLRMQVSVAGERCNVIVVASKRLGGGQKMHHGWWLVTHGPKRLDTSFSKEKGYTCTADDVFFFWKRYTSTYIKSTKEFGYTNGTGATSLPYSGNHLHWWSTGKFVNRHAGHHRTKQHSEEERKVEKRTSFFQINFTFLCTSSVSAWIFWNQCNAW